MIPASANWTYPTAIRFGAGRVAEALEACHFSGIRRPLLVTDPGLVDLPMTRRVLSAVAPVDVFQAIKSNPTDLNVRDGVQAFREAECDGVVAFGGGSVLDCGKSIAFMQGQSDPIWDFEDVGDNWKRADPTGIAPVVAVPTTAGTGSEVGRAAVVTNTVTREKKIIFHPRMLPASVILDPEVTLGLPPGLTAGAGMDALAHCLEAYFAPTFHPMSRGVAVEGTRLVKASLQTAVADGSNLDARSNMMVAASMGAVAFQKGLGAIHSLSHPIGALYDTHHGMTNAVFMPYVLEFNRPAIEESAADLAATLGLAPSFEGLLRWILDLRESIGVPHTLAELGVDDSEFDLIARRAVLDPSTATNPVELTAEGASRILSAAYKGVLSL